MRHTAENADCDPVAELVAQMNFAIDGQRGRTLVERRPQGEVSIAGLGALRAVHESPHLRIVAVGQERNRAAGAIDEAAPLEGPVLDVETELHAEEIRVLVDMDGLGDIGKLDQLLSDPVAAVHIDIAPANRSRRHHRRPEKVDRGAEAELDVIHLEVGVGVDVDAERTRADAGHVGRRIGNREGDRHQPVALGHPSAARAVRLGELIIDVPLIDVAERRRHLDIEAAAGKLVVGLGDGEFLATSDLRADRNRRHPHAARTASSADRQSRFALDTWSQASSSFSNRVAWLIARVMSSGAT
jgi:hypothetical protein